MNISVVVSAYNSEDKIADCLTSVQPLDGEVIVIDHDSTDKTGEIARKYAAHVFKEENNPKEIDIQKNIGFAKATRDWIFSLDADERLTPELITELKALLKEEETLPEAGFFIPRKNIIFGKWIEHTGWYPDEQLRLFRRGKGKFQKKHVHEMLIVDGATGHLTNPMLHENYDTVSQFLQKHMVLYAPNEAEHLLRSGYIFSWQDAVRMPMGEFLSRYFARQGYLDGFHGLMLSLLMAFYHLMIFAFLWEKHNFTAAEADLSSVSKELLQAGRDTKYWIKKEKADGEQSPILRKLKKMF